ncbi:unnamed protein product [Adineta steineri]|uniref:14-3-3 domain-containing protein n=1 Tax=Adineta steineri TaxID=433720 RepID=A0A814D4T3_9BILA|nr:unnamed protein product [Adineta steineri]CAF3751310.1 unnamed protein product [Adineta steineri]
MMTDKVEQMDLAKLAEQAERYPDMLASMKKIAESNSDLTIEERNLLSIAYKNVIGNCRASWRIISNIEYEAQNTEHQQEIVKTYRKKIEHELQDICHELLSLLDKHLILNATTTESKVFFLKMKGDYYRYLAEISTGNERQKFATESKDAYTTAFDIAQNQMVATDPIRLGLALNFSIFYYEIANEPDISTRLSKQAFDDALLELDDLSEDAYRESSAIMQLLRTNFKLWTNNEYDSNDTNQQEEQ